MKKEKMIEAPQEIKDCVRKIMQYKVIQVACDKLLDEGKYTEIECNTFKKACDKEIDKLADYLSVDRSATMREIKKLKDEKKITTDGKKITIN